MPSGKYIAAQAVSFDDIRAAQALRARCFTVDAALDTDAFDARARHFVVRDQTSGDVVCCYRLTALTGADLPQSYAAQFYDLSALTAYDGLMMELGRFCIDPACDDPDVIRIAWGALTAFVDDQRVQMLFGCSSFAGVETAPYLEAFAMLKARHLGPDLWRPKLKAAEVFRYGARALGPPDPKKARQSLPPLLRSYLLMGGWVSDHAVVDRQLNTLHVFTALEVAAIPDRRKRVLRALV